MSTQQKRRPRVEATSINELLTKPFLNEAEVAAITGRALATLRNDRFLRRGIPYLKVSGRSIRYKTQNVLAFMETRPITFDVREVE